MVISAARSSASSASAAAVSSMRLLVVSASPPLSSRSLTISSPRIARINTPQPPGPGLPLHAPSVKATSRSAPLGEAALDWFAMAA